MVADRRHLTHVHSPDAVEDLLLRHSDPVDVGVREQHAHDLIRLDETAHVLGPDGQESLAHAGKDVVREMNRLGMLIDLSHIPDPDPLVGDVLAISGVPVIDSHRGVRGAADVERNISDERLRAIAGTGGVVGLQFFSVTLAEPKCIGPASTI